MTDMTQHFHQSNLIEGFDSELADNQMAAAWNWLSKKQELTHSDVRHLHRIVVQHQDDLKQTERGSYRTVPVYIGGHEAPHYSNIEPTMNVWLSDMNFGYAEPSQTPQKMHVRYEKIHPFIDGNGRTGRLLMWWQELRLGNEPTLIKFDERQEYYGWF